MEQEIFCNLIVVGEQYLHTGTETDKVKKCLAESYGLSPFQLACYSKSRTNYDTILSWSSRDRLEVFVALLIAQRPVHRKYVWVANYAVGLCVTIAHCSENL